MHSLIQDFRFSLRQIRRSPGFMITAVLTLALGVGANTAIFSLLDQALLRSLPVRDPERLVILSARARPGRATAAIMAVGVEKSFSYPMYQDLRDNAVAFDGLDRNGTGRDRRHAKRRLGYGVRQRLSAGTTFSVLGVPAAFGRLLTQADDSTPGANPVVVLSFNYWKTHFGADAGVVGQTISINGNPFQVIGVSAPSVPERGVGRGS